ncbi:SDR family NAD(P)-dependent oxidoreductase [Pontibacter anaerobius]|uniref:SDR family oxidoreductase n=1 Tax=Pontibacter anaerobius TaxID=2993940 RepID=A0ABT3RES8_9BACT|nr:SDR family oxidoreductase [Pontibacter anaerobius]MCX2739867.1 SDR family oxidoreductase [Pontibacter anaerobius]
MEQVKYDFQDKVVLVTGGTSGIGLATAQQFAQAGAKVILTGRDAAKAEHALRAISPTAHAAHYIQTDNSQPESVLDLFSEIRKVYGTLDYAVNNAADTQGIGAPLHGFEISEFDMAMAANLKGVWLCMQQEIRMMLDKTTPAGAIVNVSSVNGLGGAPMGSLYAAAKAGVIALSKSAAQELATAGIRINVVAPGAHDTPMLRHAFEVQAGKDFEKQQQIKEAYLSFIPQKRLGEPAEAASAILWLCSDAAGFVTGHTMIVDGGMSSMVR